MKRFIKSIKQSLDKKNWYAALTMALTLPDICARFEYPDVNSSQKRYISWYNKYMLKSYKHNIGPKEEEYIFLSGNDCYSLRCSYLHQGEDEISNQRAQEKINKFMFITPPPWGSLHLNLKQSCDGYSLLQLQVDKFCEDVCTAVEVWENDFINKDMQNRLKLDSMLNIYDVSINSLFRA